MNANAVSKTSGGGWGYPRDGPPSYRRAVMTVWDPSRMRIVGRPTPHLPDSVLRQELAAVETERRRLKRTGGGGGELPGGGWAEQLRGVDAVLRWVLGETDVGPISGEGIEMPTWQQASMEAEWAEEVFRGTRPMPAGASRQYANGVWFGISWAWEVVEDPPVAIKA